MVGLMLLAFVMVALGSVQQMISNFHRTSEASLDLSLLTSKLNGYLQNYGTCQTALGSQPFAATWPTPTSSSAPPGVEVKIFDPTSLTPGTPLLTPNTAPPGSPFTAYSTFNSLVVQHIVIAPLGTYPAGQPIIANSTFPATLTLSVFRSDNAAQNVARFTSGIHMNLTLAGGNISTCSIIDLALGAPPAPLEAAPNPCAVGYSLTTNGDGTTMNCILTQCSPGQGPLLNPSTGVIACGP